MVRIKLVNVSQSTSVEGWLLTSQERKRLVREEYYQPWRNAWSHYIDPPKSVCICLQCTTVIQVPPINKLGSAVLSKDVLNTQSIHVSSSQTACAPTDAIGCCDQSGCRKRAVYSPAVTVVQQPLNLTPKTSIISSGNKTRSNLQDYSNANSGRRAWGVVVMILKQEPARQTNLRIL